MISLITFQILNDLLACALAESQELRDLFRGSRRPSALGRRHEQTKIVISLITFQILNDLLACALAESQTAERSSDSFHSA